MYKYYLTLLLVLAGCSTAPPANWQTMPAEELLKCGDSPNCVSSIDTREKSGIPPLHYSKPAKEAMTDLVDVLKSQERTAVLEVLPSRIHAVRESAFFRFKDDMFFVLAKEDSIIQVRSSARTGYSDFGVNRKNIEKIRSDFKR